MVQLFKGSTTTVTILHLQPLGLMNHTVQHKVAASGLFMESVQPRDGTHSLNYSKNLSDFLIFWDIVWKEEATICVHPFLFSILLHHGTYLALSVFTHARCACQCVVMKRNIKYKTFKLSSGWYCIWACSSIAS
jgi:hypothetical protein